MTFRSPRPDVAIPGIAPAGYAPERKRVPA